MRVAGLDLGSNTFLLLIADVENQKIKKVVLDEVQVTRLGQGVQKTREFHRDALLRAETCLVYFSRLIHQYQCDRVYAVATSAARDVGNKDEFLALGQRHGFPIHIISGDEEAHLTFLGATFDRPQNQGVVVVDIGGGSTEFVGQDIVSGNLKTKSLPLGSVRLTEKFLPHSSCSAADLKILDDEIKFQLRSGLEGFDLPVQELVAVAGTPTTLTMLNQKIPQYHRDQIHGTRLKNKEVWSWRQKLATMTLTEREKLVGMQPGRADVLVAGSSLLAAIGDYFSQEDFYVSTYGVRFGVLQKYATS